MVNFSSANSDSELLLLDQLRTKFGRRSQRQSVGTRTPLLTRHQVNPHRQQRRIIFTPRSYDDIRLAAEHLLTTKMLYLNIVSLPSSTRLRVIDFFCGLLFAYSGTAEVLDDHNYLFTL